jgi:hypothetical protein
MHIFNIHTNIKKKQEALHLKTVGGVSWTNVPYIEYVLSYLKNDSKFNHL